MELETPFCLIVSSEKPRAPGHSVSLSGGKKTLEVQELRGGRGEIRAAGPS